MQLKESIAAEKNLKQCAIQMALYALDNQGRIVQAKNALASQDYRCVECRAKVQKRLTPQRQPHFFHLKTMINCHLHSKSEDHQIVQKYLMEQNPSLQIERPFEKIFRIADLAWNEKKIVFEIQCSPIDPSLAAERMNDYAKEGYTLVWLMDDRYFNRKHTLRPSETIMREKTGYYFSLSQKMFYDQFEVLLNQTRIDRGPPLPIELTKILFKPPLKKDSLTQQLEKRSTTHYFANDLFDRIRKNPKYLEELKKYEEMIINSYQHERGFVDSIKKLFFIALEFLLRKSSHPN